MAHFLTADVVVAILSKGMVGKKRRTYGSITLATTSATYDNPGGIFLPALTAFGFLKSIDNMFLTPTLSTAGTLVSDSVVFRYDKTLHTIRCFRTGAHTPVGVVTGTTVTTLTFTGTATAQANLAELTDTATLGGTSLILYFDAIGV